MKNSIVYKLLGGIFCLFLVLVTFFVVQILLAKKPANIEDSAEISAITSEIINITIYPNEIANLDLEGFTINDSTLLPSFADLQTDNSIMLTPTKTSLGDYAIHVSKNSQTKTYNIHVERKAVEWTILANEIKSYLGDDYENFGIYVNDLGRNEVLKLNADSTFPPASMAKMTVAILVLRDIDAGKYSLQTTFPVQEQYKFSGLDDIGALNEGTEITIDRYLTELIELSSNTAWYHLIAFLGGSYEVVNPRTIAELGVNPLFLDPHLGTANSLGKVFTDLYKASTLTIESRDYLIDLMMNADASNKEGIGLGLPADIEFANKIGFLDTEGDLNYEDSAIVYGETTDYVLVIMDQNIDWDSAKIKLEDISSLVYDHLNN